MLYHSLRLYKLVPELRWAAGGFIWPTTATVDLNSIARSKTVMSPRSQPLKSPKRVPSRIYAARSPPGHGGGFSLPHPTLTDSDEDDKEVTEVFNSAFDEDTTSSDEEDEEIREVEDKAIAFARDWKQRGHDQNYLFWSWGCNGV